MFAATIPAILYAGTIPMIVAVVVRLLLLNNPFYLALASMAVGIYLYFLFLARGLRSTSVSMLEYRGEKDALIAELEEQKSVSDEARRRAEAANMAKTRFLATMSHELRTPLNAILGFSEVMKTELLGPMENPTYREYAGDILESGRHLLHLINEILDLTRIEAGRYELHEEPVRLAEVADECGRLLKLRAESKGLQITDEFEPDLPVVWADQSRHAPDLPQPDVERLEVHAQRRPHHARASAPPRTAASSSRCATPAPASPRRRSPRCCRPSGRARWRSRTPKAAPGSASPSCRT